jgi:shikimate kinase
MKIFLIGFMGSGKTTWAKTLSDKMCIPCFDLDEIIEKRANLKINDIFDRKGEQYFRKLEAVCLRELHETESFILACGGGTPCYYDNMLVMNALGITVWMNTPKEVMASRLLAEAGQRPLVNGLSPEKLQEFIEDKLEERLQFYNQAQMVIDPTEIAPDDLIKQLQKHA